jgi:hypothetical protein
VITVPSVIAALTDRVPELKKKKIETLGGSIEKIETLGVELKIDANFKGVNNNFPIFIYIYIYYTIDIQLKHIAVKIKY